MRTHVMTKIVQSVVMLLAALTLAAVAGCGASSDPQILIAKAQEYRQKGDYKAAIIELKNLLQKNPDHAEARYLLGVGYLESGDARSAEDELRRALKLGNDLGTTLPVLGRALVLQGKFKEVLDETDPARVQIAQGSPEILNARGLAQIFLGRTAEAKQAFDRALALRPDDADALLGQARLAAGERKLDEAARLFARAIAIAPKSEDAWLGKGDLSRVTDDRAGALAAYGEVL